MQAILTALEAQHSELAALLDDLDDEAWERSTRCEGWTVADVVLHLAQTDELALASAKDQFAAGLDVLAGGLDGQGNVDDGAAAIVARERGMPHAALLERWSTGAAALRDALAASDPHRRVGWVSGQLSTQTLATTRLAECWIHTGDVAEALDVVQEPTDRLEHIARLAWRTLPYAFDARRPQARGSGCVRPPRAERRAVAFRTRHRACDSHRGRRSRSVPRRGASCRRRGHITTRRRTRRARGARAGADVRLAVVCRQARGYFTRRTAFEGAGARVRRKPARSYMAMLRSLRAPVNGAMDSMSAGA